VKIHILTALKDNFIYILESADGRSAAVVDPGDAAPVVAFIKNQSLILTHILCTHHHPDHVGGLGTLMKLSPETQVWCSLYDENRIGHGARSCERESELFGESLQILDFRGHTLGQIGFYFPDVKSVFCGDTLFSAGCGRLFEGTPDQMFATLERIRSLPMDVRIFFGHEYTLRNLDFVELHKGAPVEEVSNYRKLCESRVANGEHTTPTTVATELAINPFLRSTSVEEFARWRELRNTF
jgi:hydroxyacylglutathione hydrolase